MRHWTLKLMGVAALGSLGCDGSGTLTTGAPSLTDLSPKIIRGRVTAERPAVGSLSVGCTGTLVAPEVVISAAHCFSFASRTQPGRYGTFTVEAAGGDRRYTIQRYVSYSRGDLGDADVALAQLAEAVPAGVATPIPISTTYPRDGGPLSVWGYGCTRRGAGSDWQKRRADFAMGERTSHLCPGDSGGPVFDETASRVLRVNSGYWLDSYGTDIFGDVAANAATLQPQIDAWSTVPFEAPDAVPPAGDARPDGPEVCGLHRAVRQQWQCRADNSARIRCRKGRGPEEETCQGGCQPGGQGEDAQCGSARIACGAEYAPYVDWTCTADAGHALRCEGGFVEVQACPVGCGPGDSVDVAACR